MINNAIKRERNRLWMKEDRARNRDHRLNIERASQDRALKRLGKEGIRERARANSMWNKYRIRPEQYHSMLESQGNGCAICGVKPNIKSEYSRGHSGRLHIDHDHMTGRVRGLLCHKCNQGINALDAFQNWCAAAEAYILRSKEF